MQIMDGQERAQYIAQRLSNFFKSKEDLVSELAIVAAEAYQ